jgi:hypothetical protein
MGAVLGLPFTSRRLTDELRRILPSSTVETLDAITTQMQVTVFDPLIYAASQDELRERFGRLFRPFWLQYLSASLQLASAAAHEPSAVATALVRELGELRPPSQAALVLGNDVAMMLSSAVDVVSRVLRRSIRTLMHGRRDVPQERELQWLNGFALFLMSVVPVLDALRETPPRGRRENLVILTMWGRTYALQLYAFSRVLGWIPDPKPVKGAETVALAVGSEEEERLLGEAGLDTWAADLAAGEQDGESKSR